jgi:Asp/Glu/hydantoin racemase
MSHKRGRQRRLLVINPNTSSSITERVQQAIHAESPPDVWTEAVTARFGAPYIGDPCGYAVAAHATLESWARHSSQRVLGPDGIVIACFGDPGLLALRELAGCPVTGLAEAALVEAAGFGNCAILTGGQAWKPMLERLLPDLAHADRVQGIETVELSGAQIHADPQAAEALLLQACRRIERLLPVDSLILGGAGLAGMAARLQGRLGLRLIDSVAAAAHQVWLAPPSLGRGAPPWLLQPSHRSS